LKRVTDQEIGLTILFKYQITQLVNTITIVCLYSNNLGSDFDFDIFCSIILSSANLQLVTPILIIFVVVV